jgi:hypothetical protein
MAVKIANDKQIRQKSFNKISFEDDRKRIKPIEVNMMAESNNKLQQTNKWLDEGSIVSDNASLIKIAGEHIKPINPIIRKFIRNDLTT